MKRCINCGITDNMSLNEGHPVVFQFKTQTDYQRWVHNLRWFPTSEYEYVCSECEGVRLDSLAEMYFIREEDTEE